MNTSWTLARRAERLNPSTIRELLKLTERPGIISLAGGLPSADTSIAEVLWPQVTAAWTEKQKWLGCRELAEEVDKKWGKAKLCLSACKKLGHARIMTPNQLRNCAGAWRPRDELTHQNCTSGGKWV